MSTLTFSRMHGGRRAARVLLAVAGLAWLFAGVTALLTVAVVAFVIAASAIVPGGIGLLWTDPGRWFADSRMRVVAGLAFVGVGAVALGMAHLAWLEATERRL